MYPHIQRESNPCTHIVTTDQEVVMMFCKNLRMVVMMDLTDREGVSLHLALFVCCKSAENATFSFQSFCFRQLKVLSPAFESLKHGQGFVIHEES